jgi:predicted S18 family serine protease
MLAAMPVLVAPGVVFLGLLICIFLFLPSVAHAIESSLYTREQLISFLGVTMSRNMGEEPKGVVTQLVVEWSTRSDHDGLAVTCSPGFSPYTITSIVAAIERSARLAGLDHASWNVVVRRNVDAGLGMVYGDSLSAMVGLTVVALAKGDHVLPDRVLTGTVTADGFLGPVGAVGSKIEAAHAMHFRRVIVPDTIDPSDGDWRTPFLMQVSPLQSLRAAYQALTGRRMIQSRGGDEYGSAEIQGR